jgi:ferredoxin-NADP reductase
LLGWRELAPEVHHFDFEVPGRQELAFAPGQFVSVLEKVEGKEIIRAYSIASPRGGNQFALCLNGVPNSQISSFLFTLRPGEEVEMHEPLGCFTLRHPGRHAVFVATGTGIAPFRSMLMDALPRLPDQRFTLIFGVRYSHTLLYDREFRAMAKEFPNFSYIPTLTRPVPGWTGRSGRVQQHVLEALGERRDVDVYICGLREMVDDLRAKLKETGVDRKRIIYEKYD